MDLAKGLHSWDAVIDATTHRLRPIVLTAAAASLGMIPIASKVFWGPMAYAIIGGQGNWVANLSLPVYRSGLRLPTLFDLVEKKALSSGRAPCGLSRSQDSRRSREYPVSGAILKRYPHFSRWCGCSTPGRAPRVRMACRRSPDL